MRSEVLIGGDLLAAKAEAKAVPLYAELAAMHMADATSTRGRTAPRKPMSGTTSCRGGARRGSPTSTAVHRLASKRDEGLVSATVLNITIIFSHSFEPGTRWGVPGCEKNPVRAVPAKPVDNARQRHVTGEEEARLIAAAGVSCKKQRSAIVNLLLLTGMRMSELLSTRWADVHLDRHTLFVPTSTTGRSRYVPLAARDVIEAQPRGEYLFPNPRDATKHLTTIKHGWHTVRDAAGLPDLRIHDLRHSAASFMVNSGVDPFAVGKVLGHANVASTAPHSHLQQDTLLATVEAGASKQAAA